MNILNAYCKSKSKWQTVCWQTISKAELNELLMSFYAEIRNEKGDYYKKTSFDTIKYGINQFFIDIWQNKGGIDICSEMVFNPILCIITF